MALNSDSNLLCRSWEASVRNCKGRRRLAQGGAMPFDLGRLRFLVDPIALDDEMITSTQVASRDAAEVEQGPGLPALECLKGKPRLG